MRPALGNARFGLSEGDQKDPTSASGFLGEDFLRAGDGLAILSVRWRDLWRQGIIGSESGIEVVAAGGSHRYGSLFSDPLCDSCRLEMMSEARTIKHAHNKTDSK